MIMADRDGFICLDGEFIAWKEAKIHVLTHTLHYGMGVFEGIRAYQKDDQKTVIFRLDDHIKRLFNSAHIMNMKLPYTQEQIKQYCIDVVAKNHLASCYIRPLCFYGAENMGLQAHNLKVHVTIAAWPWETYLGHESLDKGIRVKTSSFTRHHVNIVMCRAKACGNYVNSMLATQEATESGYDEALLLDNEGYVAEGSGENIFIIREGTLYTPDLASSLEGITRDTIIHFAKKKNIPIREKRITRDEVYIADEAFFTGTAAEITPIRELDGRQIGDGKKGAITTTMQECYFDCVHGRLEAYQSWLSHV